MLGLELLEREVFAGLPGAAPLVWMLPQHKRTAGLAGLQIIALEQLSCAETLLQVGWDLHTHRLAFLCLSPPPEAVRPQFRPGGWQRRELSVPGHQPQGSIFWSQDIL